MNSSQTSSLYEFEGFVLDPLQRTLRTLDDDQSVRLTSRAFDALYLLVSRHGQLVDKDTLMKVLWPKVVVEENNLSQVIYTLRQSLGEKPGEHRFIATAPGRGYQFVAEVKQVPREAMTSAAEPRVPPNGSVKRVPVAVPAELAGSVGASTAFRTSRSLLRWGASALVLFLMTGAWWTLERKDTANTEPQAAVPALPSPSVAVLPFANLTGDASKEYLGDGMAEELINTLNKVQGLKVPARTSSFAYKGRNIDIRQIAKDLGVGTVLEGSVRAAGNRIRITAQLINAQDGLPLWSESYDEEFTDIFKLQDKLATQIAVALQPNLGSAAQAAIAQGPPTQDVAAYNLYLQGASLLQRGEFNQAIGYLQQAIVQDPRFARAYAALAINHRALVGFGNREEHLAAADNYARRALALEPKLAAAHTALSVVAQLRGQYVQAEVEARQAISLAPSDASTHSMYSLLLAWTGRTGQSINAMQTALTLAPADPGVNAGAARIYAGVGRDAEAQQFAQALRAMAIPPQGKILLMEVEWLLLLRASHYAEAEKIFAQVIGLNPRQQGANPTYEVSRLVHAALADPRKRAAAVAASSRLYPKAGAKPDPIRTFGVRACMSSGLLFGLLKANDVAYELLNRCLDAEWFQMSPVIWLPELREFRQDPRFHALASRLGYIELFQQYGPPDDCAVSTGRLVCH